VRLRSMRTAYKITRNVLILLIWRRPEAQPRLPDEGDADDGQVHSLAKEN
jgi:hypothetical protein